MNSKNETVMNPRIKASLDGIGELMFRNTSSDTFIIEKNLISGKPEYQFPNDLKPKAIWDIGANIGIVSIMLNMLYPEAKIYAFEPQQDNLEILKFNVKDRPNIQVVPFGLSDHTRTAFLYGSSDKTNFGGWSVKKNGIDDNEHEMISLTTPQDIMNGKWNVPPPDLIKIDCEGSEYDILCAFGEDLLGHVQFIAGEMHCNRNDEYMLLMSLNRMFKLKFEKDFNDKVFNFAAINRNPKNEANN